MSSTRTQKSSTITTGFAIFSMLFGAGNIVFALAIGQYAQDKNLFAILGLLITAVGVPLLGLVAMALFNGDYKDFFNRIGKVPGFALTVIIMGLIGSFGAIPRCIALSYSTSKMYLPDFVSLPVFAAIACCFIFLCTYRPTNLIKILGYILTPLKLGSLTFIIIIGLLYAPEAPVALHDGTSVFFKGLKDGYLTMDLLATFFFCSVVLKCLKQTIDVSDPANYKQLIKTTLKASFMGAGLLAVIYVGFSYVSAAHSGSLEGISPADLISNIAVRVLGPYAGLIVSFTVTMACLTTAIALSTVFAEFIHKDLAKNKISYISALLISLLATYFMSTLNFGGIMAFLAPVLQICYPALITLCCVNILNKLYDFSYIKLPVFTVFAGSLVLYFV